MNLIQYRGGRYADPDFDAYAMLQPPASFRTQRISMMQYVANTGSEAHNNEGHHHHASNSRQGRHSSKKNKHGAGVPAKRTALAQLQLDEDDLNRRKANIAKFGATWLRPPGIPKTYQAMADEAAEREEQEAQARREAAAAEEQRAAREAQFAAQRAATGRPRQLDGDGAMDLDDADEQEHDLDDDVPEAAAIVFDDSEDETGEDGNVSDGPGLTQEDLDGEEGFLEEPDDESGSGLELERDLDNSIPSAGSYQHTDTDVEDSSSVDEGSEVQNLNMAGIERVMSPLFPPSNTPFTQGSSQQQQQHPTSQSRAQGSSSTPNPTPPTRTTPAGVPIANALNPPQILDGATGRFVHSIEGTEDFMPVGGADMSVTSLGLEMGHDYELNLDEGSSFLLSSPAAMMARRNRGREDNSRGRSSEGV